MNKKGIWQASKGFTLVELLVVIAIIAILAAILVISVGPIRARARDTQRVAHINQIVGALEQYLEDEGSYPVAIDDVAGYFENDNLPLDPRTKDNYNYEPLVAGDATCNAEPCTGYWLWAGLEQTSSALGNDADLVAGSMDGTDAGCKDDPQPDNCKFDKYIEP